jgi:hypothetical protein
MRLPRNEEMFVMTLALSSCSLEDPWPSGVRSVKGW